MLNKRISGLDAALFLVILAWLGTTGCSNQTSGAAAPPPEVEVVAVEQRDVPIYSEWIGTLDGFVNADIKAQVSGYLLEQSYSEGSFVKKGQLLFSINAPQYEQEVKNALAAINSAAMPPPAEPAPSSAAHIMLNE